MMCWTRIFCNTHERGYRLNKLLANTLLIWTVCIALSVCGCQSKGTLALTSAVSNAERSPDLLEATSQESKAAAELSAAQFTGAFEELITISGKELIESAGENDDELAFIISDYAIGEEYSKDFEIHVYAPFSETESITLSLPLPALKSEDDIPKGDQAALTSVHAFNEERLRERASFMDCVEATIRAVNRYKNSFSEADVMLILSEAEKTIKRGSEQSEDLSGTISRSFLLDIGYVPKIVFTLEFAL
jgi:hypothetical protein